MVGTIRINIQSQELRNPPLLYLPVASLMLNNQQQETPEYQAVAQQHNIGSVSAVAGMLSPEQMLDVMMADEAGPSKKAFGTLNNPREPESILRIGNNYLEKISHWILITGRVTFIASNTASILFSHVFFFDLDWTMFTLLKLECLAWHWISYDEHIRIDN